MILDDMEKRRDRWLLAGLFMLLMVATRYHHFGSILHLPDASWAIFLAVGFYFRGSLWLVSFLALAAAIDYFAITKGGSSGYCISPAYPFLIPAYGALWLGGRWFAGHRGSGATDIARLLAVAVVATSVCFLISNGAFYWFSGRFEQTSVAEYLARLWRYYPMFLRTTMLYVVVFAALHAIAAVLRDIYGHSGESA